METDQFDSFVEEFLGERLARPLTIIGTAKIEDLLFSILSKYLKPKNSGKQDDLLDFDKPIGTFSAKIKLVYRLGIIDDDLFKIMEQVRKIRNLAAHSLEFNANKSPVRDHLSELSKFINKRSSYNLTKTRYFNNVLVSNIKEIQCMFITICVLLEIINSRIKETGGVEDALNISKN